MFSYAGVPLGEHEATDVSGWIAQNIRPEQVFPFAYRSWPGHLSCGPILNITPEEPRPIRISSLFWPVGATRFGRAHFVCSKPQVDRIRSVVLRNGVSALGVLAFSDMETRITARLWMLPCLHLQAISGMDLYLLTLVDDRYWWWGQSLNLSVTTGTTTWYDLYSSIGTNLGVTIDVDPVNASYGMPTIEYATGSLPLPLAFDAVAFSVGQRVVRLLDGTVKTQNPTTADAVVVANQAVLFTPYAGGAFDFNPRR